MELATTKTEKFVFVLRTITIQTNQAHISRFMTLPFWVLCKLRSIFAKWLAEDGTYQQIGAAPKIPHQLFDNLKGMCVEIIFL